MSGIPSHNQSGHSAPPVAPKLQFRNERSLGTGSARARRLCALWSVPTSSRAAYAHRAQEVLVSQAPTQAFCFRPCLVHPRPHSDHQQRSDFASMMTVASGSQPDNNATSSRTVIPSGPPFPFARNGSTRWNLGFHLLRDTTSHTAFTEFASGRPTTSPDQATVCVRHSGVSGCRVNYIRLQLSA